MAILSTCESSLARVTRKEHIHETCRVQDGGVSRIRPGQAAELIAENIPNAASMCYDSGARQLVIPMNANNAIALLKID